MKKTLFIMGGIVAVSLILGLLSSSVLSPADLTTFGYFGDSHNRW